MPNLIEQNEEQSEQNSNQAQEWETTAQAWLCAFPEAKAVNTTEVDSWIDSNYDSLPADTKCLSRSEIIDRILSIQNYMKLSAQVVEVNQVDIRHARFQRTDQWLPVYSWLESLDKNQVVKSKDIHDWLTENPEIKEQLSSRHSQYHLLHYIKKCHMKTLKRKQKKKGLQQTDKPTCPKLHRVVELKGLVPVPVPAPDNPLSNIPKDGDLYLAKQNEALRRYEILLELEKKLAPHFQSVRL